MFNYPSSHLGPLYNPMAMASPEIAMVRQNILIEHEKDKSQFDDCDIDEYVRSNDVYIGRYIERNDGRKSVDEATNDLAMTLKWRRANGIGRIKADDFPAEFFQVGGIAIAGKDVAGARVIVLRIKMNKKVDAWYVYI